MEVLDRSLFILHVLTGTISLILFWIPAIAKKGSPLHIQAGKWYQYNMWVVLFTAFFLSMVNFAQGEAISASFFIFLTLFTAYPLWYAVAITHHKQGPNAQMLLIRKFLNGTILLFSLGMFAWYFFIPMNVTLLMVFGMLGVVSSTKELFSTKVLQRNWLDVHIRGMIFTGVAAHTAFFAFGGSRILGSSNLANSLVIIPWILPTIIGITMTRRALKKWAF